MKPALAAAAFCFAVAILYFWFEPALPFAATFERSYMLLAILAVVLSLALFARNLLLSLTTCLLTLIALEIVFLTTPSIFPDNIRLFVESGRTIVREEIVEQVPYSPFAKPKPNALVRIPGYYGPKDQFEYEWLADRRGFKNLAEIAALDKYDVVALGDSFTEGMGVKIEDTWTTRLHRKDHSTYNLGIQGYAPTQFRGAYERYGKQLEPKWVIVGMLGNVFERERKFINSSIGSQAIDRLIEQDEQNQKGTLYLETRDGYRYPLVIGQRHRFVTSALIALTRLQINFALHFDPAAGVANAQTDPRFAKGSERYRGEVELPRYRLTLPS
jgi:hypothetical protein